MNTPDVAQEAGAPASSSPSHAVGPFQGASAAALADFAAPDAQPVEAAQPEIETAPEAVEDPAAPAQPDQPTLQDFEEELTVAGRQLKLNRAQLREFAQKGVDYTRKTMELAQQRKQFETEYQQAVAHIKAELAKLPGGQPAAAAADAPVAEDIPNVAQVQQLLKQQVEEAKLEMKRELAKARHETEFERYKHEYTAGISAHLTTIKAKFPEIADLPGVDALIRQNVGQIVAQNPTDDINVVRALIDDEAGKLAQAIKNTIAREAKARAVAAAARTSTEPPGGSIARSQEASKSLKLGSKELRAQVLADLGG